MILLLVGYFKHKTTNINQKSEVNILFYCPFF